MRNCSRWLRHVSTSLATEGGVGSHLSVPSRNYANMTETESMCNILDLIRDHCTAA